MILSKHITRELAGRRIEAAFIEAVLAAPVASVPDSQDPSLTRSFAPIAAFGNRVLRVVHRPEGDDIFIVTAHWDRGAKR